MQAALRWWLLILVALFLLIQYALWFGEGGKHDLKALREAIAEQEAENSRLRARNAELEAEIAGLREGLEVIEEYAREELGFIAEGEIFYQVIDREPVSEEPQEENP